MKAEYIKLIEEFDRTSLSAARTFLNDAKSPDDRVHWKNRIDELLDKRLILMKARDAAPPDLAAAPAPT